MSLRREAKGRRDGGASPRKGPNVADVGCLIEYLSRELHTPIWAMEAPDQEGAAHTWWMWEGENRDRERDVDSAPEWTAYRGDLPINGIVDGLDPLAVGPEKCHLMSKTINQITPSSAPLWQISTPGRVGLSGGTGIGVL